MSSITRHEPFFIVPVSVGEERRDARLVKSLWKLFNRDARTIFNNSENDQRRLQAPLRFGTRDADLIHRRVVAALITLFGETRFKAFIMNDWNVLVSRSGCQEQMLHTDFDQKDTEWSQRVMGDVPHGVIYALQNGTRIVVRTSCGEAAEEIQIPRGHALVFRGDTVHAGASYDTYNLRVHAYIDLDGVRRKTDRTYIVDDHE